MELLISTHAGMDNTHRRRWVSEKLLPRVSPTVVLRLLMRHCSISLMITQTNSDQNGEWHGVLLWSAGRLHMLQGDLFRKICHLLKEHMYTPYTICAQKHQNRVAFHTGLEGEGPSYHGVHLSWTYKAGQPFACIEATGQLFWQKKGSLLQTSHTLASVFCNMWFRSMSSILFSPDWMWFMRLAKFWTSGLGGSFLPLSVDSPCPLCKDKPSGTPKTGAAMSSGRHQCWSDF